VPAPRPPRRARRLVLGAALLLGALAATDALFLEPNLLVVRRVTVPCPGLRRGPVRIALFSDSDFVAPGRAERALAREVQSFAPDLVLVAGDFLGSERTVRDPGTVAAAAEFLGSLPAPAGRFLAPGEEESDGGAALRAALGAGGTVVVLSNEARSLEVRGERISLFGADIQAEPAPWATGSERGRSFVFDRARERDQLLVYAGDGASGWGEVEISFAFQPQGPDATVDFRFAWRDGEGPWGGDGLRLIADPYRRDMRLYSHLQVPHSLPGRRESGFVPAPGAWSRARVRLSEEGSQARVRARFWREGDVEPGGWSIDATDLRPSRDWRGTVAFAGRSGSCRYTDLVVAGPGGARLLEERFADPGRLRGAWRYRSALADWVFDAANRDGARLVLAHNPDVVLDLADLGGVPPDLVLAGHTHGGQVRLPWIGALYTATKLGRRFDAGLFDYGGMPLYITAGMGTSDIPVRFCNPPEVVLLTLVPSPRSHEASPPTRGGPDGPAASARGAAGPARGGPAQRHGPGGGGRDRLPQGQGADQVRVEPVEQLRALVAQVGGAPLADAVGRDLPGARELPQLGPPDLQEIAGLAAGEDLVLDHVDFHDGGCASLRIHL
jgi:predicted MPP superfamily phosphohydrolase